MLGDAIEEEDEIAKGSAEEAKTKEHQHDALSQESHLRSVLERHNAKPNNVVVLEPDTAPGEAPTKF